MNTTKTDKKWLDQTNSAQFVLTYGDEIYCENDSFNGIYYIEEGSVKMTQKKTNKQKVILFANADEFCGLKSYYASQGKYLFTASVYSSECKITHILAKDIYELMEESSEFNKKVINGLCRRINTTEQRIIDFLGYNKKGRYLESLLELAYRKMQDQAMSENDQLALECTLSDFSSITGSSEEYLKKITQELSNMGILVLKNRKVVIKNIQKLKSVKEASW